MSDRGGGSILWGNWDGDLESPLPSCEKIGSIVCES